MGCINTHLQAAFSTYIWQWGTEAIHMRKHIGGITAPVVISCLSLSFFFSLVTSVYEII